jgi:hypothetical protein
MSCEKCGSGKGFCPVTLGLALGLTCSLGVLVLSAWMMWFGLPSAVESQMGGAFAYTWGDACMAAVWALLKGFVSGFVFALIYNLICCCKAKCCGKCSCCVKK